MSCDIIASLTDKTTFSYCQLEKNVKDDAAMYDFICVKPRCQQLNKQKNFEKEVNRLCFPFLIYQDYINVSIFFT